MYIHKIISGSALSRSESRELVAGIWPEFEHYLAKNEGYIFDCSTTNLQDIALTPIISSAGELGLGGRSVQQMVNLLKKSRAEFISRMEYFCSPYDYNPWEPCLDLQYFRDQSNARYILTFGLYSSDVNSTSSSVYPKSRYDASSLIITTKHYHSSQENEHLVDAIHAQYQQLRRNSRQNRQGILSLPPQNLAGALSAPTEGAISLVGNQEGELSNPD